MGGKSRVSEVQFWRENGTKCQWGLFQKTISVPYEGWVDCSSIINSQGIAHSTMA